MNKMSEHSFFVFTPNGACTLFTLGPYCYTTHQKQKTLQGNKQISISDYFQSIQQNMAIVVGVKLIKIRPNYFFALLQTVRFSLHFIQSIIKNKIIM